MVLLKEPRGWKEIPKGRRRIDWENSFSSESSKIGPPVEPVKPKAAGDEELGISSEIGKKEDLEPRVLFSLNKGGAGVLPSSKEERENFFSFYKEEGPFPGKEELGGNHSN